MLVLFSDYPDLAAYILLITAVFGLVMGSFLNCLAWRLTHGESVLHGRSHCTSCGHELAPADLVPLFSWLFLRGRCRYCKQRISARYPLAELTCALVYVALVARFGLTPEALELVAFSSVLLVLTLTDLDAYLIPNGCIVAAIVIRLAYLLYMGFTTRTDPLAAVALSLLGGLEVGLPLLGLVLIMDRVLKKPSMGGGDLKLLAVAGMYFGWMECLFLVLLACVFGIAVAMAQLVGERTDGGETSLSVVIPWGPSIAAACVVTMLVGSSVTEWYLGMF